MNEHLARLAVACYPPTFRARYGEEMAALVSDRHSTGRTVVDLFAGAARAWVRPVLAGGDAERRRRRLQATVATIWTTLIAGFLVAPATDRALLDPAPPHIPAGTVALFTIGAAAAGVAGVLVGTAGLRLFLETMRASDRGRRRRILSPLIPGIALVSTELAGLAGIVLWRRSFPALGANPDFPGGFTTAVLLWGVLFVATLIAVGFGPALALTRANPPTDSLRLGARVALPVAALLTVATVTSAIAAFMLLSSNEYDWFAHVLTWGVLAVAAGASVVALVSAGRGSRIAYRS